MLRRLFLYRFARRHLGQIVGLPLNDGGVKLTRLVSLSFWGGIELRDHDGDLAVVPWDEVRSLAAGLNITDVHDRQAARYARQRAERAKDESGRKPALSPAEIDEILGRPLRFGPSAEDEDDADARLEAMFSGPDVGHG